MGIWNPTMYSNSRNISNPDFLKIRFQIVQFSNGRAVAMAIAIVPSIQNPDIFVRIWNGFWQNGGHLSSFQRVGLPDFRSHSKSGPFTSNLFLTSPDFRSPLELFRPWAFYRAITFWILAIKFLGRLSTVRLVHWIHLSFLYLICPGIQKVAWLIEGKHMPL